MVDNVFCHREMNEPVLSDVFEALGFMVMEPLGSSRYRLIGKAPDWFPGIFGTKSLEGDEIGLENISPFTEHFGPVAEQFWSGGDVEPLKSGAWVEIDEKGNEVNLELVAMNLKGKPVLLLQLLGQDHAEKRELLQRFREKGLDYEILFKTQRALRIAHDLLLVKQRKLKEDLAAAAEIQRRFLPRDMPHARNVRLAFKFRPCSSIAGDMFNVVELDEDNIAIYILDVSGHGAPAAMMAVSVCQMLQLHSGLILRPKPHDPNAKSIVSPNEVLDNLDLEFPIERFDKYFTMFYAVLNCNENLLTYSNAGHPLPIIVHRDGALGVLDKGGTIIGLGGLIPFEQGQARLEAGDKILLYSDGVTELENGNGEAYGMERLQQALVEHHTQPVDQLLDSIQNHLTNFLGNAKPQDDISLLGLEITAD